MKVKPSETASYQSQVAVAVATDRRRRHQVGVAAIIAGAVFAVDQLSKLWIRKDLLFGVSHPLFPGLTIVRSQNSGVSFRLLSGERIMVIIIACAVIVAVIVYLVRYSQRPWTGCGSGFLIGGAVGNLFDHVRVGAVTDFIQLGNSPVFNLADVSVAVGALILATVFLFEIWPQLGIAEPVSADKS